MVALLTENDSQIDDLLANALRLVAETETMRISLHIRTTGVKIKDEEMRWESLCNAYKNKK
jgi:hypothetical protein